MAILQRKNLKKGSRAIAAAVCFLLSAVTAAGCGKVEDPVSVELSAGNMEDIQDDTAGEAGQNAADDRDENSGDGNLADDKSISAEGGTDENAKQMDDGSPAAQDDGAQQEQDAQSAESTQLEGDVRSVDADSFVICKHETWEEDGYSYAVAVAPGYEEESDLITIHMAQNCGYQYKTVKNSGINPEDVSSRDGSFADVKEGLMATIEGNWQDDGSFLAVTVVLSEII